MKTWCTGGRQAYNLRLGGVMFVPLKLNDVDENEKKSGQETISAKHVGRPINKVYNK